MIKCPYCGKLENTNLYTANTRDGRVRRRRKCEGCGRKFTTYEVLRETIKEKGDGAFVRLKKGRIPEDERDDRCRDQDSGEDSWPLADSGIGVTTGGEAMKYRLTLNETQLQEVKEALELRFRIDLLQGDMLSEILATMDELDLSPENPRHDEIFNSYLERRDHINALITALFEIASPYYSRAIGRKRDKSALRCEDIWQVVRHQIWLDSPNHSDWNVDSREAMQVSDQELPQIERIDE